MNVFDVDMVTIERAAEHLNISVASALVLAERYSSIRRARRHGVTVYSLTQFMKMHLKEAFQQQQVHPAQRRPQAAVVLDDGADGQDDGCNFSDMRWMDDGGPEKT